MQSSTLVSAPATKRISRPLRRLMLSPIAVASGVVIVVIAIFAIFGPLEIGDAGFALGMDTLVAPSGHYWLGTDELGRSVAQQLVLGCRTSLIVGVVAAVSATLVGIGIGAVSGFAGKRIDTVIMRVTEVFQVMPTFVLAAVIVAMWGTGTARVVMVIVLLSWPQTARLMRGEVMRVKNLSFVSAARCMGLSESRILWSEVVPNAVAPVLTLGTLIMGQAILMEATLAFFGLTSPEVASWGKMLNSGQRFFYQAWWLSVFPGIAIFLTVLAFNLFGDECAAAFNPRATESEA